MGLGGTCTARLEATWRAGGAMADRRDIRLDAMVQTQESSLSDSPAANVMCKAKERNSLRERMKEGLKLTIVEYSNWKWKECLLVLLIQSKHY